MARAMTEAELLEFYELNRRAAAFYRSKGQFEDAQHRSFCMKQIEMHLFSYGYVSIVEESGLIQTEEDEYP